MRILMEITNEKASQKIVFKKINDKLQIWVEEDFNNDGYSTLEIYEDIDFKEFKKNIDTIEESIGYYTEDI